MNLLIFFFPLMSRLDCEVRSTLKVLYQTTTEQINKTITEQIYQTTIEETTFQWKWLFIAAYFMEKCPCKLKKEFNFFLLLYIPIFITSIFSRFYSLCAELIGIIHHASHFIQSAISNYIISFILLCHMISALRYFSWSYSFSMSFSSVCQILWLVSSVAVHSPHPHLFYFFQCLTSSLRKKF